MKNKHTLLLLVCCAFTAKFYGQQHTDTVSISYEKNKTNDTVWLYVSTTPYTRPGSLMLVANSSLPDSRQDTSYYPLIDTSSVITLAVPELYQSGSLQLKAFFYPEIFEVRGKILSKVKNRTINAVLITANQRIYNKALSLNEDNHFSLPGFVFEKQASLIFKYASADDKGHPDVSIQQTPTGKDFKNIIFTGTIPLAMPPTVAASPSSVKTAPVNNSTIPSKDSSDKKTKLLNTVTVVGTKKSNAEKFNELYSDGLFKQADEKVIDCIDNTQILSFPDCLSFLRSQVAGLQIGIDKFGDNYIQWRGHETKAFFIDEIPVDIDQFLSVNVVDIAIIKVFPPPFSGGSGTGDGGGFGIYTRRGEYKTQTSSDNQWLYSIKGYSAPTHILFSGK